MSTARVCGDVRRTGGIVLPSRFAAIQVTGEDAVSFLDSQLPLPIAGLEPGHGGITARLERRGRIRTLVLVAAGADAHRLIVPREHADGLRQDLEAFHIREAVTINRPEDRELWDLTGPAWPEVLKDVLGAPVSWESYASTSGSVAGHSVTFVSHPWSGALGGHLIAPSAGREDIRRALQGAVPEAVDVPEEAAEVLLMEGGWPSMDDLGERALIAELGREEEMASFNKGCYLGQETVARLHHRGRVQRRFRGLLGDGARAFNPGAVVLTEGTPVGEITRSAWSPSLERVMAFAWLKGPGFEPGAVVHVSEEGSLRPATVSELPFYRKPGAKEEAARLRRRGMEAFNTDDFSGAVAHFERALLLDPMDVDAREAMGVCYERMGDSDEALRVMEELRDMAPDHVMAWTNLSRYYAASGLIQEAEEAKGRASYLSMKQAMGEAKAKQEAEAQSRREKAQSAERLELFKQVLELDPEDAVANFGLGKLHLDRGEFALAEPLLRKAVAVKPDYSMAYNHLATCLAALDRRDEAVDVLSRGIEVAAKQGDFMPKQSMERRLSELAAGSPGDS